MQQNILKVCSSNEGATSGISQAKCCTPNKAGRAEDRQIYEAALWQWTGMQAAYQDRNAAAGVMAGGSDTTVRWNNSRILIISP